ncbi:DUF2934 domain-containing protein [Sinorhizobium sp. BG8]|uniref:DUF2934 domain-containing protein n=1 Tax=Sinorhizobium sp. BG8 TaxID=2613773 RepID=UPI00193D0263|nr:DUF2934 domain-containing protein [Sinorhizobium sp. BG8]QRM57413.1 DUF2934 domain-containing protein [Sinorhizobium sp. BG8]
MSDTRTEWISKRAYSIWELEGRPHGRDDEHWKQAVRERDELERVALPGFGGKAKATKTQSEKSPTTKISASKKKTGIVELEKTPSKARRGKVTPGATKQ